MKKYALLVWAAFAAIAMVGCKKSERDINENLTEVKTLFTPADNAYIKLNPAANTSETFEWDQARAEDGALVLYEVAFDQESGDFSKPFYTVVSNNRGIENKLSLTHGQLNQIAFLGGADFFQRKKFKWTVLASKGTNVKQAAQTRIIELERPGGFAQLPGNVYIYGTATEAGGNMAQALKMKQLSSGVFEIFTKLKAGTYKFVDGITGTPRQFYVYPNAGIQTIGVNGETTFTGADKVMRITLNFNDINAMYAEVKSLRLWYSISNTFIVNLNYAGGSTWKGNWTVNLVTASWGALEERHKYKMVLNDGTGDKDLWLNYATNDSPGQDGAWPHTTAYRTLNMTTNNSSQWDWTWKFDRNYLTQGSNAEFTVSFSPNDPAYTMSYRKL